MQKTLTRTFYALAAVFLLLQVIRPERTNPPVVPARTLQAQARVPDDVGAILDRACGDCHSNQTRWPWYSRVEPISWFVVGHVDHGRRHLNFSDWVATTERSGEENRVSALEKICREVRNRGMPLRSYLLLHPSARLSEQDIQSICSWTAEQTVSRGVLRGLDQQAVAGDATLDRRWHACPLVLIYFGEERIRGESYLRGTAHPIEC